MFSLLFTLQLLSILSLYQLEVSQATEYTYTYRDAGFSQSTVPKKMAPKVNLANGDQFGYAVSVWSTKAIISSSKLVAMTDGTVDEGGVVYLFYQRAKSREWYDSGLEFITPYGLDGYGASIAIWQDTIVVGAPLLGNVHIYSGNGYQTETEISPHGYEEDSYFGHSVAIVHGAGHYSSSGAVVVGAYGHSQNKEHQNTGSVFVYAYENYEWKQVALMEPSMVQQNGYFGYSVAAYGNTIAVGAPGADAVFVYSLVGTAHECPHEGHMPEGCEPEHHRRHLRRRLQEGRDGPEGEGEGREGEGPEGEDHEQQDREREEQEREERERQERQPSYFTEWKYKEELEVMAPVGEELGFGTSVAVYNKTDATTGGTIISVAIGAVYDYESSSSSATGSVYIISQMQSSDVIASWHPSDFFEEHQHEEHHRALQGGGPDEHHNERRYWPIKLVGYTADKLNNYWMLETTLYGTTAGEKFGYAIAIEYETVVVGNHPEALGVGRAEIHSRVANTGTVNVNIPLFQGPLYKTKWQLSTNLNDVFGGTSDMFGGAVSMYGKTIVVGSYLTGFDSSSSTIGTGAAYVYDAVETTATAVEEEEVTTAQPEVDDGLNGLMKSLTVVSFSFIVAVFSTFCGLVAYKYTQRKIREGTFDSFYNFVGWTRVESGGIKLSEMDSSLNSEHAMLGNSSQHSSSSTSSSSSSGNFSRAPPGPGAGYGGRGGGYQPRQPPSPGQRPGPPAHQGSGRPMAGGGHSTGMGRPAGPPGSRPPQQQSYPPNRGGRGQGPSSSGNVGVGRSGYASLPGSSGGGMTSGMSNISGL